MRAHSIHCIGYRPAGQPFDETKCDCGYLAEKHARLTEAAKAVCDAALRVRHTRGRESVDGKLLENLREELS